MPARQTHAKDPDCPLTRALALVGQKWSLLIVRDAYRGLRRFNEFQSSLGIPRALLAHRLRSLTQQGILQARPLCGDGSRNAYTLTDKGRALVQVIGALNAWSDAYL